MTTLRPIPVFTWSGDLEVDENDDDGQRLTAGMARIPTDALREALEANNVLVRDVFRDNGLGGYFLWADADGTPYKFFLNWTGIGDAEEDYFAIQGGRQKGLLASLFSRRETDEEISKMVSLLSTAINQIPEIENLQWLTEDEFHASYCDGKPLPKLST